MQAPLICLVMLAAGASAADLPDLSQISALSRTFLRDSAELPMDVQVRTLVTDAKSKKKRDAQSNVVFLFKGYNAESERYGFRSTSGLLSMRILHDSVGGTFATINAFSRLIPHAGKPPDVTIEPGESDAAAVIRSKPNPDCHGFRMSSQFLYGDQHCYAVTFRVARDTAGKLAIQDFVVDIEQLPAAAKVRYLGDVEIRKIQTIGDVQEARMGDDPRPFLIPKRVTTTIETDKGKIVVTNDYQLRIPVKK